MHFNDVFSKRPVFLAVVHADSSRQVLKNVAIARDNGADGVFLINHAISTHGLICAYRVARTEHPDWWLGLNMLDLERPIMALNQLPEDANGLWTDALDHPDSISGFNFAARLKERRATWRGLYFGGVAFKGQPPEMNYSAAAKRAERVVDVITTSGRRTGSPPSLSKVTAIRAGAGDVPVAVASGIDSENVADYAGLADCFMVASSIGKSFTELDPALVREFADVVHGMRKAPVQRAEGST